MGGYDPSTGRYFARQSAPQHLHSLSPRRQRSISPAEATDDETARQASPELGPELSNDASNQAGPSRNLFPTIDEARGTRRSRPISVPLSDLIASPLVASVAGGFDPALGKYTSRRKEQALHRVGSPAASPKA